MEWSVASMNPYSASKWEIRAFREKNVFLMGRSGSSLPVHRMVFRPRQYHPFPPQFLRHYHRYHRLPPPNRRPRLQPPPVSVEEPPATPVSSNRVRFEGGDGLEEREAADATNADASRAAVKDSSIDKEKPGQEAGNFSESISRLSDGSTASFRSFAFPMGWGEKWLDEGRAGASKDAVPSCTAAEQQTPKISDNVVDASEAPEVTSSDPPASAPPAEEEKGWFSSCFSCCSFCK
ncbi:uncharacterized protein A4U43_C04F14520 [Asparagus officinalis]|uniref:Uncharacterized protein n=1 Tax=Asparagus officinalis TaxID=4686 RepID=A0A5P1F5N4_ASPOF|nr:uncharacterized protein A4U43_C04F14520 [Asparagus officinalis]